MSQPASPTGRCYLWAELTGDTVGVGNLANLRDLVLSGNQLTGPVPTWLGSLANLEELYLWDNKLTGEIPSDWAASPT